MYYQRIVVVDRISQLFLHYTTIQRQEGGEQKALYTKRLETRENVRGPRYQLNYANKMWSLTKTVTACLLCSDLSLSYHRHGDKCTALWLTALEWALCKHRPRDCRGLVSLLYVYPYANLGVRAFPYYHNQHISQRVTILLADSVAQYENTATLPNPRTYSNTVLS